MRKIYIAYVAFIFEKPADYRISKKPLCCEFLYFRRASACSFLSTFRVGQHGRFDGNSRVRVAVKGGLRRYTEIAGLCKDYTSSVRKRCLFVFAELLSQNKLQSF